jgi:4-hydroxybenzoate polyprenyltransferase
MVDRDDDIHLGIHSSALFFGKYDVLAVMICYGITLALLAVAGLMAGLGIVYFAGLVVAEVIAFHHYNLIKSRKREQCFAAFMHNNWLGRRCLRVGAGLLVEIAM